MAEEHAGLPMLRVATLVSAVLEVWQHRERIKRLIDRWQVGSGKWQVEGIRRWAVNDKFSRGVEDRQCGKCCEWFRSDATARHGWQWKWCGGCIEEVVTRERKLTEELDEMEEEFRTAAYNVRTEECNLKQVIQQVDQARGMLKDLKQYKEVKEVEGNIRKARAEEQRILRRTGEAKGELRQAEKRWVALKARWGVVSGEWIYQQVCTGGKVELCGSRKELEKRMQEAVAGLEGFKMKERRVGDETVVICGYQDAAHDSFMCQWEGGMFQDMEQMEQEAGRVRCRRECRGSVIGDGGIVARPLHRFFSEGQVDDTRGCSTWLLKR